MALPGGRDDDYPVPRGKTAFASIIFPDHRGPAQAYAMRGMRHCHPRLLRRCGFPPAPSCGFVEFVDP